MTGATKRIATLFGDGFARLDALRRWQGQVLDDWGAGPEQTPFRVIRTGPGLAVRAYGGPAGGIPILIVPAPIKRCYIWDLAPHVSVVRRLLDAGFRVFLAEWIEPDLDQQQFGLAEYADRFLREAADAVAAETGCLAVVVVGHSLGGTLSAIFATLHAECVLGLVLIESPLCFAGAAGAFAPMVAAAPSAHLITEVLGSGYGSFLNLVSIVASPRTFLGDRIADRWRCAGDRAALHRYLQVERWTMDEFRLPCRLFEEVIDQLYRNDDFQHDRLRVGGRPALPAHLVSPIAVVVDPRSEIIPPGAVLPVYDRVPSRRKLLLRYRGDTGVALQHVGALVGRNAHETLWPALVDWIAGLAPPGANGRATVS